MVLGRLSIMDFLRIWKAESGVILSAVQQDESSLCLLGHVGMPVVWLLKVRCWEKLPLRHPKSRLGL